MKRFSKYILIAVLLLSIPSYSASLLDTLIGKNKTCNYVDNGKYMPFSDLQSSFPIFGKLVNGGCVDVTQNVTNMFQTGFKVFLGIVSLLAVVRIAIAGIQYIFQEQSPGSKSKAKQALTQSVVALILAFSGWVILNTVNTKLTDVGFNLTTGPLADLIQKGAAGVKNIAPTEGECIAGTNCGAGGGAQGGGAVGTAPGTGNAVGSVQAPRATIFGYRDGNGTVGNKGDNGLGNAAWSPVSGWSYYNGGAHNPTNDPTKYSQGVALPRSTLIRDFGSASNVKNGAYEIFVNGKSIGAFPVVDDSAQNFDLTYGLVKNHIDKSVTSSNSWDSSNKNISYKPLPNYWLTNTRPPQPMVRNLPTGSPNATEVDDAVRNPNNFKIQ